jgi:hypothetical protein
MKILCSGHLVRYPQGGHSWHHLQYLVGFLRLGHEVTFFEHFGWPDSCYDPARNDMTSDPSYGLAYLKTLLEPHGLQDRWCYLAEDGTAYGMSREQLAQICRECDVYFNLSNINWISELEECRLRVLVDTDPVFSQIGGFGMGGPYSRYHRLFTYGENVHRPGSSMPDGGVRWLPTRQPVVTDLWPVTPGDSAQPFTTVMNWSAYGDREWKGEVYGQKDREFEPFFSLPQDIGCPMEMAVAAPTPVRTRLQDGGWNVTDPRVVSQDPWSYQQYLRRSRAEFCVAKHGYVRTHCGWFSDRSTGYLASGRPVVVQDTGFSDFLPCGQGLLAYRTPQEAVAAIRQVNEEYDIHCRAARVVVEKCFDARRVLGQLLEASI